MEEKLWQELQKEGMNVENLSLPEMFRKRENIRKNRYSDVIPSATTRVVLGKDPSIDQSYINANWIQHNSSTQYIATQAPVSRCISDFWRMIYENKVSVILMLTKLIENGRNKADQYWPEPNNILSYNDLNITFTQQQNPTPDITIRFFTIQNQTTLLSQNVVQIHFTGWPDFGTPQCINQFLDTISLVEKHSQNSPIVVHCSAGLGRTGTWIAAHVIYNRLKTNEIESMEEVDFKDLVVELRKQRRGMIQSLEQFKFLYSVCEVMEKESKEQKIEEERNKNRGEESKIEEEFILVEKREKRKKRSLSLSQSAMSANKCKRISWSRRLLVRTMMIL
eukprot:TRINITY_DN19835_c0_g1_i1.p1 TRINITY_DN19835_c0_g1~~TRINITY_DN19835_c0_g1_i1.p1  ORF type:complete len:336 (-),score=94.67 TRINITY_DN19835_c0_g1_i1:10-1017(-)